MTNAHSEEKNWQTLSQWLQRPEMTAQAPVLDGPTFAMDRRRFLALLTASSALAGATACRRPVEHIVPYAHAPEQIVPGIPLHYTTTMPFDLDGYGILATSREGRPIKVDGNPDHPSIHGGSNVYLQSSILDLYDPDRSTRPLHHGEKSDWQQFILFWQKERARFIATHGNGLAIVYEQMASPSRFRLLEKMHTLFPQAVFYCYNPVSVAHMLLPSHGSGGVEYCKPVYHLDQAEVILTLDADILGTEPNALYHCHGFHQKRTPENPEHCHRLYVVEPSFTITGQMADHRLRLSSAETAQFLQELMSALRRLGLPVETQWPEAATVSAKSEWLQALASDLYRHRGNCLIMAGRRQPAFVHQYTAYLNTLLANVGKSVDYRPVQDCMPADEDMDRLQEKLAGRELNTVILLNANPAYNHALNLDSRRLLQTKQVIHFSAYQDESAKSVQWHLPASHYLEHWGDMRDWNGVASIIQPLIQPLYDTRSDIELLQLLLTGTEITGYELTRATWQTLFKTADFESAWQQVLLKGYYTEPVKTCLPDLPQSMPSRNDQEKKLEFVFQPSYSLYDGRFANNGWLLELPDPVTKISWDTAALVNRQAAAEMKLENGDLIRLERNGFSLELPVCIIPGQADHVITLSFGYGRSAAGQIGNQIGANVYKLRNHNQEYYTSDILLSKTDRHQTPTNVQESDFAQGRPLIREATMAVYQQRPHFARELAPHPPLQSLWKEHTYQTGFQWAMVIDLNLCNGCNACVIACQCENNIPIVGREQVAHGREMHWIRLDRYFSDTDPDGEMAHQPVACQHCENAPCEQVCPVAATVHDQEGLNVMAYNRCVGTRYCSNNCPYKARRFNFFNYTGQMAETVKMTQNPEVTVRSRGVMEKCTFCLQRLAAAKQKMKQENRVLRPGELQTACQQACPMKAISFGNLLDAQSAVCKSKNNPRNYELLAELNIRPRTSYLARIKNKNPDWI